MAYQRKPKARAGYTGKLAEPMPYFWEFGGLLDYIKESPGEFERITKERQADAYIERLGLLFMHYGIDPAEPSAWRDLTVALAMRHVPGFQLRRAKSVGAPKKWNDARSLKLHADVVVLRRQGLSLDRAIATLIARGGPYRRQRAGSLKVRFKEALTRSPFLQLFKQLRAKGAPVDDWIIETFRGGKAASNMDEN